MIIFILAFAFSATMGVVLANYGVRLMRGMEAGTLSAEEVKAAVPVPYTRIPVLLAAGVLLATVSVALVVFKVSTGM